MNDELKDRTVHSADEIPDKLLPEVGKTYADNIGRTLKVQEVVPEDKRGREVRGLLTASKTQHTETSRAGESTTTVLDIPKMKDVEYACPLYVFEAMWVLETWEEES